MVTIKFLTKRVSNNELIEHSIKLDSIKQALNFWREYFPVTEIKFGKPMIEEVA